MNALDSCVNCRSRIAMASALAVAIALGAAGCARWSQETEPSPLALPPPQKSPSSVTVETVLVRFPASEMDEISGMWNGIDESILDFELRQLLDRNGLRIGLITGELPYAIRQQLEATSQAQTTDALEHAGLATDVDNRMHKLQFKAGKRKEVWVRREIAQPLTVLYSADGKKLAGATYNRVSTLFDLRAHPHEDGRADPPADSRDTAW